jgi:hypothetical protein
MDNLLKQLIKRLDTLEKRTEEHLLEASGIKTDLAWLKKLLWLIVSVDLTAIVVNILKALKGR